MVKEGVCQHTDNLYIKSIQIKIRAITGTQRCKISAQQKDTTQ